MSHIDFVEVVDPTSIENFTNPVEVFNQKRPLHHFKTYYSDHDAIIRIKKVPRDYNLDRLFNKCN